MSTAQATKYLKLPNGNVVATDAGGGITVVVNIDLSEIIDNDLDGLNDIMSERATGSVLLTDIGYSVVGHEGDTLLIRVTGHLDDENTEEVVAADLPLRDFEVDITRIGYGCRTISVKARTEREARELADDEAGNHEYSEHTSEYVFDVRAA